MVSFCKDFVKFKILIIFPTNKIVFGSVDSFKSYSVHKRDIQKHRQTDIQTHEIFLTFFEFPKHMKQIFIKKRSFSLVITIICFFTYSVCDDKIKMCQLNSNKAFLVNCNIKFYDGAFVHWEKIPIKITVLAQYSCSIFTHTHARTHTKKLFSITFCIQNFILYTVFYIVYNVKWTGKWKCDKNTGLAR